MPQQDKPAGGSPFEIITPGKSKKAGKTGIIVGVSIVLFLILSVVAGVLLVRQQQTIAPKAVVSNLCPGAEACPYVKDPTHLWDCHPAEADGTVNDHICNSAGYVATCGAAHTQYCCPSVGAAWTTNMTVCNQLATVTSPSPTPNLATDNNNCGALGHVCASGTTCQAGACISNQSPTPTATPTETPTPAPGQNACNGTCGSNSNCQSGLYCYSGSCRNPLCASDSTCGCASATNTPTPTAAPTSAGTTRRTTQTTPLPIPVTGVDWPTIAGVGVGISAIVVSILLAL